MKALLEKYLTKIPMYTLISASLALLLASSVVLSLFNVLSFSPLAIIASVLTFTVVSVGANFGIGKLYGVSVHMRSAVITAFILSLLFTPTLDIATLAQYGFIAVLAQASKFILTYRRRHLFNPAAIGALIGGAVLNLQFASWWVGTPVLFVPILLTAFFILYKTRQLALGGLFAGVALTLVTFNGLFHNEELLPTLFTALSSWPILFAAGFMLSEPLTLPPRKWQRLLIAAVAGIIVALPFHIGTFYSSPEFAIIIANSIAFALAFRQRRHITLTLKEKKSISPTSYEFIFTTDHVVAFEAGQYIELTLPHNKEDARGIRRTFSITSAPNERELRLGIKFYEPSSSFKKQLLSLPAGSEVQTTGISGDFVLPKDKKQKLLLIAGGIGITPFISHVLASKDDSRDITLLYFIRSPEEAAYKELLDASGIAVTYFVSEQATDSFITAPYLTKDLLRNHVSDASERSVYISGPPAMVAAAKQLLKGDAKSVHTDYFSGY